MEQSITVIIPAFNRAESLPKAIDSALEQPYPACEVVVIDDGSTDNTQEVLAGYEDRIKAVYQKNAGVSAARNYGVRLASGEWVLFLDSDDQLMPNALKRLSGAAEDEKDLDVLMTNFWHVDENDHIIDDAMTRHGNGLEKVYWRTGRNGVWYARSGLFTALVEDFFSSPATSMIRRSALGRCGGFNEAYSTSEDLELFLRFIKGGSSFGYIPQPLFRVCQRAGSLCRGNSDVALNRVRVLEDLMSEYSPNRAERRTLRKAVADTAVVLAWRRTKDGHRFEGCRYAAKAIVNGMPWQGLRMMFRSLLPF